MRSTAAMGRRESKVYEDSINGGRVSFLSAPFLHGMLEGGVPIMKDGQCLGAVGVSGVKSNEDVQIARAGLTRSRGHLLLQGERQKFLEEQWPRIHATIQRLGLTAAELLKSPVDPSPMPDATPTAAEEER